MRVLVTGGAGFIGSHVVDALLARGAEVVVLDNLSPAAHAEPPPYLSSAADLRCVDVTDEQAVAAAVVDVDAVSHQAARVGLGVDFADVTDYVTDNDVGTAVLLKALWRARFAGRLVVASSMVVYGEGRYSCAAHGLVRPGPRAESDLDAGRFEPACPRCGSALVPLAVPEDAPLDPRNVYAATKVHTEHLAQLYGRDADVPVALLRYHNVYGPRMPRDTPYAGVASIFRSDLEAGRVPSVTEDGSQRRDFVHVADVARANVIALLDRPDEAGAFNIASGEPHTVLDLATALSEAVSGPGGPPPTVTGRWRAGDVRHIVASPDRGQARLGFEAHVDFATGMRELASAQLRTATAQPTPARAREPAVNHGPG